MFAAQAKAKDDKENKKKEDNKTQEIKKETADPPKVNMVSLC